MGRHHNYHYRLFSEQSVVKIMVTSPFMRKMLVRIQFDTKEPVAQ